MKHKLFAGYGMFVLALFAFATHEGYAWANIFAASHHHRPGENHYHK